jgi:hypothetical protein
MESCRRFVEQLRSLLPAKASAKEITTVGLQAISEATDPQQLQVARWVFQGYKPNAPGSFKKRLRDWTADEDVSVVEAKVPKTLSDAITKQELCLSGTATGSASSASVGEETPRGSKDADLASAAVARLAELFRVEEDRIHAIRRRGDKFSLPDIAALVCRKDSHHAAQQIRNILDAFPELIRKIAHFKFRGRGQRETPCGDIYTVVEVIMLLPGKTAAAVRTEAARALVHIFGGSLELAEKIIANHAIQENLRVEEPATPARVFGDAVEREGGRSTCPHRKEFERALVEFTRRKTSYDPGRLSEVHHSHKDKANKMWIDGAVAYFGGITNLVSAGHVVVLDDFDGGGIPRSSKALIEAGVPPSQILSPNKEQVVVDKLQDMGVQSVKKHINHALESDFRGKNVVMVYLDSCTGDVSEMEMMIDRVRDANKSGGMILAYTLVTRNFTEGGAPPFTRRILNLVEYLQGWGFRPLNGTLQASYIEYHDESQRVGTAFWKKPLSYS